MLLNSPKLISLSFHLFVYQNHLISMLFCCDLTVNSLTISLSSHTISLILLILMHIHFADFSLFAAHIADFAGFVLPRALYFTVIFGGIADFALNLL